MLFVDNPFLDPFFNLAAEEYFLKYLNKEIIMIWRSNASIIIGKHQNTLAEINLPYVIKNDIPVVRRLSGGGTVFHDPGNINFTFIKAVEKERMVDFEGQVQPVIEFLKTLGIDARFQGKNDLRVNGLKISGNAEHVYRNKVLHHGTLLFDSNLDRLNEAIKSRESRFESKAIKSLRSNVANISSFLETPFTREEFMTAFRNFFLSKNSLLEPYELSDDDIRIIERIKMSKYILWEWNYAYSPVYTFKNKGQINGSMIEVQLKVKKGVCESYEILIDKTSVPLTDPFYTDLKGIEHNHVKFDKLLQKHNFMNYNNLSDRWELLGLFF
jgi:lipoate---protein ligase